MSRFTLSVFLLWNTTVITFGVMGTFEAIGASKEVIDLGTLEVQGKLRGPEIQLIDSNQMGEEALTKSSRMELKKLEQELLKPASIFTSRQNEGAGK